jgi:hypothetical protein
MQAYGRQPSRNRQCAFIAGIGSWAISTVWLVASFDSSPLQPPLAALVGITALGALGSSAVIVEVRRSLMRHVATWTEQAHFRWVLFWAVVLFVLQFTGIDQALGPVPELL